MQRAVSEGLGLATASPFGLLGVFEERLASGDIRLCPEVGENNQSIKNTGKFTNPYVSVTPGSFASPAWTRN